jgi:hypothetical protein
MDRRYHKPVVIREAKLAQPRLEFSDAGIAVSDAGKPLRLAHALAQEPRDLYRDRFRLSRTGAREDHAVSFGLVSGPLARIVSQLSRGCNKGGSAHASFAFM